MKWRWNRHYKESDIDPLAPVNGGLRWLGPRRDPSAHLRDRSIPPVNVLAEIRAEEADEARRKEEARQRALRPEGEPREALGPHFTTTAPEEARAGGEYVYQPKAFAASVNGFT